MHTVSSFAPSAILHHVHQTRRTSPPRERRRCRACHSHCTRIGIVSSLGGAGTAGFQPPASPGDAAANLAREIGTAFVVACTRTDVPYAAAIREFVSLALDAYTRGISLSALRDFMLQQNALASDELELRDVWLALVYKTLRAVRFPAESQVEEVPPDQFDAFVRSIVAAKREGSDLKRIQLDLNVSSNGSSPLESAILSQSTRLVVATLDEADERRRIK